jgi:hypothetical protein
MSNFQQVCDINATAGNTVNPNWTTVKRQLAIIEREWVELNTHIEDKDAGENLANIRDDLCDVLVTVYGMGYLLGLDLDADMLVATEALKSRFDTTPEDYEHTRQKYLALGVPVMCRIVSRNGMQYYVTVCTSDVIGTNGEKYVKGKWLKSYKFHEPVYSPTDIVITD